MGHTVWRGKAADLDLFAGQHIAIAFRADTGAGLHSDGFSLEVDPTHVLEVIDRIETTHSPRWVWWDQSSPRALAEQGVALSRCWDVLAVERLLQGGWRWSIPVVWATLCDLDLDSIPRLGQLDLLDQPMVDADAPDDPVQPNGHLRPEWVATAWGTSTRHLVDWASLAHRAAKMQIDQIDAMADPVRILSTAHAESAASMLCGELELIGLPLDVNAAEETLETIIGPRPSGIRDEEAQRDHRDREVLRHVGPHQDVNLRNSDDVRSMLRRVDVEVEDTRAWRLEQVRDKHPVVEALLEWRKAERLASTYGYRWLDEHVREGRLRGTWSSSDGSAGRMTASAGLHNLPADLRPAIVAEPGFAFVRADLGQVEPRVLAAVSGDPAFIAATASADLYDEVATQLRVSRDVAKLAVLGAMYGATTGESAHALRRLEEAFPVAMSFLEHAAQSGVAKVDLRTIGGRRINLSDTRDAGGDIDAARTAAASRGRYARNAVIQGAAAEFFKIWAVIVRSNIRPLGANIVLCLHDELLVHTPSEHAETVAQIVTDAVSEAAHFWSPAPYARFIADVQVVARWSDAKA